VRAKGIITAIAVVGALTAAAHSAETTRTLRVGSIAFIPVKWDKAANARTIERMVREAAGRGARLVVAPEGALEGYLINEVNREKDASRKAELARRFREIAEPMDGPYMTRFRRLADELDIHLVVGLLERDDGRLFNTAVLLGPDGRIAGKYHKSHFMQGYDANPPGYTPGGEYPVFDIGPLTAGIMICFDRQPPEPARALALHGADLILCPAYGSYGKWNTRLMQVRAYENDVFVIYTNPHHHFIIDTDGELLGEGGSETVLVRDLDLTRKTRSRPSIRNRRPETYGDLTR
jgi:predicted amidohydrolase